MITARLLHRFGCLMLLAGLSACTDHREPAVSPGSTAVRLRVKFITQELPDNLAKVSSFRYDAQGRLSSIYTYQSPDSTVSDLELSRYQYDEQNRLTQLRRELVRYPRGSNNRVEQYTYAYNAAGQVAGIQYANGFSLAFAYNGANQLISSNRQFSISGLQLRGTDTFTFTGDNLTTLVSTRQIPTRGGPELFSTTTTTFTHDDKPNPFYGVYVIPAPFPNGFVNLGSAPGTVETYYGGIDNALNLSRNNVLSSTQSGVSTVYQYQYNAAGLPTLRTTITNNAVVQTLSYQYETY